MSWKEKIMDIVPDIGAAIATGGASIPASLMKIIGTHLVGNPAATEEEVRAGLENATPEELRAIKQDYYEHRESMAKIQKDEMQSARDMYDKHDKQTDRVAWLIARLNPCLSIIIGAAMVIAIVYMRNEGAAVISPICTIGTLLITKLMESYGQMVNFRFGSSIGSVKKNKTS